MDVWGFMSSLDSQQERSLKSFGVLNVLRLSEKRKFRPNTRRRFASSGDLEDNDIEAGKVDESVLVDVVAADGLGGASDTADAARVAVVTNLASNGATCEAKEAGEKVGGVGIHALYLVAA
jgi:hypothetical protein